MLDRFKFCGCGARADKNFNSRRTLIRTLLVQVYKGSTVTCAATLLGDLSYSNTFHMVEKMSLMMSKWNETYRTFSLQVSGQKVTAGPLWFSQSCQIVLVGYESNRSYMQYCNKLWMGSQKFLVNSISNLPSALSFMIIMNEVYTSSRFFRYWSCIGYLRNIAIKRVLSLNECVINGIIPCTACDQFVGLVLVDSFSYFTSVACYVSFKHMIITSLCSDRCKVHCYFVKVQMNLPCTTS